MPLTWRRAPPERASGGFGPHGPTRGDLWIPLIRLPLLANFLCPAFVTKARERVRVCFVQAVPRSFQWSGGSQARPREKQTKKRVKKPSVEARRKRARTTTEREE